MKKKKLECYVLVRTYYNKPKDVVVFYEASIAKQRMEEDMQFVKSSLVAQGNKCHTELSEDSAYVAVAGSGIYYQWEIYDSTIHAETKKQQQCYVVICDCYSGENSAVVCTDLAEANKEMLDELEIEKTNLSEYDYSCVLSEHEAAALYTQDEDIYYEWGIYKSPLQ